MYKKLMEIKEVCISNYRAYAIGFVLIVAAVVFKFFVPDERFSLNGIIILIAVLIVLYKIGQIVGLLKVIAKLIHPKTDIE